jgi:hypothetical protein
VLKSRPCIHRRGMYDTCLRCVLDSSRKHHGTGDEWTDLRQFNLSRRQGRALSQGAAPSTCRRNHASHPIQFGRTHLLQPEFGTFQDDLRSYTIGSSSVSPRLGMGNEIISALGNDVVIEKMHIGNTRPTESSGFLKPTSCCPGERRS